MVDQTLPQAEREGVCRDSGSLDLGRASDTALTGPGGVACSGGVHGAANPSWLLWAGGPTPHMQTSLETGSG